MKWMTMTNEKYLSSPKVVLFEDGVIHTTVFKIYEWFRILFVLNWNQEDSIHYIDLNTFQVLEFKM